MKYWKVSLLREGHCARQWHVKADCLTVGSHGANKVRLPLPVDAFALQFTELEAAETHQVGPFTLLVEDETHQRQELWAVARTRVEVAVSAASMAPREAPVPVRIAIATVTLLGLTNLVGSFLVDGRLGVMREYERTHPPVAAMVRTGAPTQALEPRLEIRPIGITLSARVAAVAPVRDVSVIFASTATQGAVLSAAAVGTPNSSIPAGSPGQSWDGAMLAYATGGPSEAGIPADWLSSTPVRYRAPWPDSPVPPH